MTSLHQHQQPLAAFGSQQQQQQQQQHYLLTSQEPAQIQQDAAVKSAYASQARVQSSFAPGTAETNGTVQPFLSYSLLDQVNGGAPKALDASLEVNASQQQQQQQPTLSPSMPHYAQPMGVNHLLTFAEANLAVSADELSGSASALAHHSYGLHPAPASGYAATNGLPAIVQPSSGQLQQQQQVQLQRQQQPTSEPGGLLPVAASQSAADMIHLGKADDSNNQQRLGHQAGQLIVLAHAGSNR